MDKSEFYDFMLSVITAMERQGRYSTAHVSLCIEVGSEVWRTLPAHGRFDSRLAAKLSGVFVEAVIAVEHDFHVCMRMLRGV